MDGDLKENASVRPTINTEKLFGQCFEAAELENGALIPVGGGSIFSDKMDIAVIGDFENFTNFYDEAHSRIASKYSLGELEKLTTSQGIQVDPKLFATLLAFTEVFEEKYPRNKIQEGRFRTYSGKREVKLSELFANNTIACAEITALAQSYLQREDIDSKFFSGDVLWNKSHEFSEKHSFIVIPQDEGQLLYDPTNPTNTPQGPFPSIYTTNNVDFSAEVRTNKKRFIEARNILFLNKKIAYFGVNNGTNVAEETFVQGKT